MEHYDQLHDTYQMDDALPPDEYNSLVRILDSQLQGALQAAGEGVVGGLSVEAEAGTTVRIAAGAAIIATAKGNVYVRSTVPVDISVTDNSTQYVWAQALLPETSDFDSRETADVYVFATGFNVAPPDAIALATVITSGGTVTAVNDTREFVPAQAAALLADRLAAAEDAVGTPYENESDLDSRVTALEDGAVGGGGYAYWQNMPKSPGDSTTPGQAMQNTAADAVDEHEAQYHGDDPSGSDGVVGEVQEPWDIDSVNQGRHLLADTTGANAMPATQVDAVTVVWGEWGDGNNDSPDHVDRVNSTWVV